MAQMGFVDLSDYYASLDAGKGPLVAIVATVLWEEFRPVQVAGLAQACGGAQVEGRV